MKKSHLSHSFIHRTARDQQGQTLILALMILFMLVFIGGLFVTLIVKNIGQTKRVGQNLTADYLAETGIRYACDQLAFSMDGADWRPVPNYPDCVRFDETGVWPAGPVTPSEVDPDYNWLMKGFCRFTYGDGRFLVKVSYKPRFGDPISKYIKIECIGRTGVVDDSDPTTLQFKQPIRLRSERVAYKAIGITDYARYITNKDRLTDPFALGMPAYLQPDGSKAPFIIQYGDRDDLDGDGNLDPHGGSIRVNGNLEWYGTNYLWLSPMLNESVEVAGDITHHVTWSGSGTPDPEATAVYVNPPLGTTGWESPQILRQSADDKFDTLVSDTVDGSVDVPVGLYRDGRAELDTVGRPRAIQRLEAPVLESVGPAGGMGRYREITRNSGDWVYNAAQKQWFNTGYYGWGKGLYIDNREDIQTESELKGMRDDWMNPGGSQYWAGPYYTPPGVVLVLTPYDLDNADGDNDIMTGPDMILMQTNVSGAKYNWYDPNGEILTPTAGQLVMPYPENGVVFAEGNLRVKGTVAPGRQLTVVSGATIYIEGNILKYPQDAEGQMFKPTDPRDSGVALLATDYVCVNTTQFFGPAPESQTSGNWRPNTECYGATVGRPLTFNFAFGLDPASAYLGQAHGTEVSVYVRHAGENGPSYMNMTLNQLDSTIDPWFGMYHFDLVPWSNMAATNPEKYARQFMYPLADVEAVQSFLPVPATPSDHANIVAAQQYPMWEHNVYRVFPLSVAGLTPQNYAFNVFPGATNLITFGLDQNLAKSDYLLSRFAVQPADIRIEALLYAQNASFYIIPGEWFNPDVTDNRAALFSGKTRRTEAGRIDPRWPLHGDPLDVRITIYGAISENVPAPIEDQIAWAEKWGWIPPLHGNSADARDETFGYRDPLDPSAPGNVGNDGTNPYRQRGLTITYDNQLSYPKVPNNVNAYKTPVFTEPGYPSNPVWADPVRPVRYDAYYRPLPITPRLPVSDQTLYFGQPT